MKPGPDHFDARVCLAGGEVSEHAKSEEVFTGAAGPRGASGVRVGASDRACRARPGVVLGRPRVLSTAVRERIAGERGEGTTLQTIADRLTVDGVPTARGGDRWHPSSVRKVALTC
jgi:hypothetical protein